MTQPYEFESERLGFRRWKDEDKPAFAKMNCNKEVMRYFPKALTRDESDSFINKINKQFIEYGYGLWAVEIKSSKTFIGFIGFYTAAFEAYFTPCIEIGWRLDNEFWNRGYATEGAKACLEYGFNQLGMQEIYSFTAQINKPSINVMKKIGMVQVDSFEHPRIETNHPLRPHVLFKIDKSMFNKK